MIPIVKGHAITICNAPPYQSRSSRLLQEVLSLEEQNKFPSRYPFQHTMIFSSPHFLGLSDQTYALKLQEQEEFHHNEEADKVTGLLPLTHTFPDTNETLGSALLSFSEPSPGSQYLIHSIESDASYPSALYLCRHYANVSYLESFKETLFPTLKTKFTTISSSNMWHAPNHHHSHQTLDDLLSCSTTALSSLLQYSPYGSPINPPLPP